MSKFQSGEHIVFVQFVRSGFHHNDGVCRSGHNEVEIAVWKFLNGWIKTRFPSIRPMRAPAIGLENGMSDTNRAADAPVSAITSG